MKPPRWTAGPVLVLALAAGASVADPMKPLTSSAAMGSGALPADPAAWANAPAAPATRLSATRSDASGRWQALLGTQWLRVGDRHDGARVLEVDANRLVFSREGQRETLFLLPPLLPARAARGATPRPVAASAPRSDPLQEVHAPSTNPLF